MNRWSAFALLALGIGLFFAAPLEGGGHGARFTSLMVSAEVRPSASFRLDASSGKLSVSAGGLKPEVLVDYAPDVKTFVVSVSL